MGNKNSCDQGCKLEKVKTAMKCFKSSVELQRQFQNRMMRLVMVSENDKRLAKRLVESDFKYALKHYKDDPVPDRLNEIYARYPTLLEFLPNCASFCTLKM
ncbi:MAG: hypothetical protein CMC93_00510 [Flavobacteriaceae bacterium]|nr:hypothetical protein [Flavobacteriaceae bacterium]|tara:strand:- start:1238 stop:1540 length:303 start_codon:yes stop_codon:yes gene_type:complete